MASSHDVRIGTADAMPPLPAEVQIGAGSYFLIEEGGRFELLSAVCPHMGNQVRVAESGFACPVHHWTFDGRGRCLNVPGRRLESLPVSVRDGELFVDLPSGVSAPAETGSRDAAHDVDLSISLIAHACLHISCGGFSIVTDPWFAGPAFLGAWAPYPEPSVEHLPRRPGALCITHEHSDHLHPESLAHFDRGTPVFFPAFPNRRIERTLTTLGFTDLRPLDFGTPVEIGPAISLTAYEPEGIWNDCIMLFDLAGRRFLNLNDAGVNHRIARLVAPVDIVASTFSFGASGFPLTWDNFDEAEKVRMMDASNAGRIQQIRHAMELYGATHFFPFASHFTLWHPTHAAFTRVMRRNNVATLAQALADAPFRTVALLAGESWDVGRDATSVGYEDRAALYTREALARFAERYAADAARAGQDASLRGDDPNHDALREYFEALGEVPEIAFCPDITVQVDICDAAYTTVLTSLVFRVRGHLPSVAFETASASDLRMTIPGHILGAILRDNLSWDEAIIGYWCRFSTERHVYHAGFWRLLQAPYFRAARQVPAETPPAEAGSSIASILVTHGDQARRVLNRYGLYCGACHRAPSETLGQAAAFHGLGADMTARLVRELNAACAGAQQGHADV